MHVEVQVRHDWKVHRGITDRHRHQHRQVHVVIHPLRYLARRRRQAPDPVGLDVA